MCGEIEYPQSVATSSGGGVERRDMVEVSMHRIFPIQVLGGEAAFSGNVICHFIAMDAYMCFDFL